jgi:phage shock protein C
MKKFYRSYTDKKISGVCSGLAQYTSIDVLLWRILFVCLLFTPFPIITLYLLTTIFTKSIEWND